MATPFSDSKDDELYVLASQQYEQSVEMHPVSPAIKAMYDEMDKDEFLLDKLLPPEECINNSTPTKTTPTFNFNSFTVIIKLLYELFPLMLMICMRFPISVDTCSIGLTIWPINTTI